MAFFLWVRCFYLGGTLCSATTVIKRLNQQLDGKIPVIAAGGILTAADAQEKQVAGAALVQLYSGLIYRGPKLINDILKARTTP